MDKLTYGIYKSPVGRCVVVLNGEAVCYLSFLKAGENPVVKDGVRSNKEIAKVAKQIFDPKNKTKIPVVVQGTDFQIKVWKELRRIPFGQTRTYHQIAKAIGKPRAARAVGSACGVNPVAYLVPCHRVLASGGALGGYSGGFALKRALLKYEGVVR